MRSRSRTRAARARARVARRARKLARAGYRRVWRESTVGGRLPDQHDDGRRRIPDRIGQTSSSTTTRRPTGSTVHDGGSRMAPNVSARGMLPEGRQIIKGGDAIARWVPLGAAENHEQLLTVGRALVGLGGQLMVYVETLIGLGLSRRIADQLVQAALTVTRAGGDVTKADMQFALLYAAQIDQESSNVAPMQYPARKAA